MLALNPPSDVRLRSLEEVLAAHPLPFPPKPDGTPAELEKLQVEDINALVSMGRALADLPVGYGKTVIGTYATLRIGPDVTLILVPPILIVQWVKWLKSVPGLGTVFAYAGTPKERAAVPIGQAKWLVMSYGIFRNDYKRLVSELGHKRAMTIVDEAQALKNYRSELFKGVRDFAENKPLLLLSGTPVSWPGDIYAYVKLNNPEAYATYAKFEQIHVEEFDYFNNPKKWREEELMKKNFSLSRVYRSKEEVHSALPKANFIPIYYDLDPKHMSLYRKLMSEQLLELDDGTKIDASTAQTLYHQAQQIITNWGAFSGDEKNVAKVFELIDEVCDEINLGQPGASKLILWTQYKRTSAAVQAYMDGKLRAMTAMVNGKKKNLGLYAMAAYSGADSKKSVAAFLDDPNCVDLNAVPTSAGAGLNPQHLCWECGFVEFPTRTIHFVQSSGRIDRKGQIYNPNIRLFIARGTVQEGLFQNLLSNDDEVVRTSGTKNSIRNMIFPQ